MTWRSTLHTQPPQPHRCLPLGPYKRAPPADTLVNTISIFRRSCRPRVDSMATTRSRTRPSGGATRQETIDVIRREATDVADTEFAQPEGSSGPSLREIDPQIFFGTRNSGMQVGVNHGSITIAPSQTNVRVSQTIFGNLAIQDEQRTEFNSTRNILRKKARLQTGRRVRSVSVPNHHEYSLTE